MAKHINVYVTVEGVRKPLGTFDLDANAQVAEARADHRLGDALNQLEREGRDVSKCHTEKVYVDTEKLNDNKQPREFLDAEFKHERE